MKNVKEPNILTIPLGNEWDIPQSRAPLYFVVSQILKNIFLRCDCKYIKRKNKIKH